MIMMIDTGNKTLVETVATDCYFWVAKTQN